VAVLGLAALGWSGGAAAGGSAMHERSPSPAGERSRAYGALSWRRCDGTFRCATLRVPVSYARPAAGTIGIAVVELPATGRPLENVVMNPGGPGVSGVQFLEQAWNEFPASLRAHANLVSFDPRGVGESAPVRCLTAAQMRQWLGYDPDPRTAGQIAGDVAQAKSFVTGCLARNPRLLLANLGTVDTAADLDRLRAALGQARLDYIGFSYGTYLAEVYAERFPSHVGRLVLDGVIDPALPSSSAGLQQAIGFERELSSFFAWCAGDSACRGELPAGAERSWRELMGRLEGGTTLQADLAPSFGGAQRVDLGMAETGAFEALYWPSGWPALAEAIAEGLRGDGRRLALLAFGYAHVDFGTGSFANLLDVFTAVSCEDAPSPRAVTAYAALAARFSRSAPDFGPVESWGALPCAYWPFPVTGLDGPVRAPGAPPVLVVGSTGDPATPYAWAQAVARQFRHAVLVTRDGVGHTGYDASACVRGIVDTYLEAGALPRPGTVCASG
jgi:pimeloyl-ACP methyl ester carboxylesterase